jgi:hypothetical protein
LSVILVWRSVADDNVTRHRRWDGEARQAVERTLAFVGPQHAGGDAGRSAA